MAFPFGEANPAKLVLAGASHVVAALVFDDVFFAVRTGL